jgi:hypothetical protein
VPDFQQRVSQSRLANLSGTDDKGHATLAKVILQEQVFKAALHLTNFQYPGRKSRPTTRWLEESRVATARTTKCPLFRQTAALDAVLNGQQRLEVQVSQRNPGFIVGALDFVGREGTRAPQRLNLRGGPGDLQVPKYSRHFSRKSMRC